jgi:hypothetical protein
VEFLPVSRIVEFRVGGALGADGEDRNLVLGHHVQVGALELDKAAESGQHGIGHHPFAEGTAIGTAALHRGGHHLRLRVRRHAPAEVYAGQEVRVCLVGQALDGGGPAGGGQCGTRVM